MPSRFHLNPLGVIVLSTSLAIGCGEAPDTNITPLPDAPAARKAIEAAMENWKAARPTGQIDPGPPRIQVNDSFRKKDQTVERYEILGQTTRERSITFVLRVTFSNPDEVQYVRFVLLGVDPIIVFRQEDYDLMSHWEHKMDPEPSEPES